MVTVIVMTLTMSIISGWEVMVMAARIAMIPYVIFRVYRVRTRWQGTRATSELGQCSSAAKRVPESVSSAGPSGWVLGLHQLAQP